ncbi:DUF3127 domain-containing protein [Akkermansiaceae bacterium]|nr:DUF3127 domain-containing protein [Akkermansiaceae bacterium]
MYKSKGNIKLINETQTFPSGFSKREFVVTVGDDKYPQDIKYEVVKDKCSLLDNFAMGQEVEVSFDIRGNEYNGKYYVNLACWKIFGTGSQQAAQAPARSTEPTRTQAHQDLAQTPATEELATDDIPF